MKSTTLPIAAALATTLALLAGCATQPAPLAVTDVTTDSPLANCQVTGSRIRVRDRGNCSPLGYPMRSYSAADLQSTGEIDLVDALRMLDPSFQ